MSWILSRGEKFNSQGCGKFAKDVVRIGKWVHPRTGQKIEFDNKRIQKLADNTNRYLKAGNRIPFPDGHTTDAKANMGFWDGFLPYEDKLISVVDVKDEEAAKKIAAGTIDQVSVYIEFDVEDSQKNKYDEVITHVCATNYPVLHSQGEFVKLSKERGHENTDIMIPEALSAGAPAKNDVAPATGIVNNEALRQAFIALSMSKEKREVEDVLLEMASESLASKQGDEFPGGFDGCVRHMMDTKGMPKDHATKMCAYIGRRAGKIQ